MIASYSYPFAVEKCTTLAKNDELKLNVNICTNPAEQATAFAAIIIQNNDIDKKIMPFLVFARLDLWSSLVFVWILMNGCNRCS